MNTLNLKYRATNFTMQAFAAHVHAQLLEFVRPYVEVGFDAHQIKEELEYQGFHMIPLHHIDLAVSTVLGEAE